MARGPKEQNKWVDDLLDSWLVNVWSMETCDRWIAKIEQRKVELGHVAEADSLLRVELEAEEVLERAGDPETPILGGDAREILSIQLDPLIDDEPG